MAAWTELHAKQQDVQTLEMDLPTQPELRAQLLDMAKEDQDARQEVLGPGKPPLQQNPDGAALLDRVDEKNLALLYKLIAEYDIPTPQAVGRDGIKAFWLLVQHAKDIRLQKRVLQVIATGRRGVPPDEVALLDDRIAVAEGRPQKYGSQFHNDGHDMVPSPIEDEAHLDERRAAMGLPPFEDYRCVIREIYRNPAPGPAPGG